MSTLAQITNPAIGNLGTIGSPAEAGDRFSTLLATALRFMVVFGAILLLIMLVRGSMSWITAEGKPDKLEKARNEIVQSISGMVILAAVVALASFLGYALGLEFLQTLNVSIPGVGN
jgi:UDP-N-acetylmuramyl pentapeptide phosphotransferase/UDP-N-acetylglucosamine-1-phosphate transferase